MGISLRPLIPLLSLAALAACASEHTPEPADVASQGIPPAIKVTANEQHHTVYVLADKGIMSLPERHALVAFLASSGALGHYGTHVTIRGALPPARLAPIAREVAAAGVDPAKIEVEPVPPAAGTPVARRGLQVAVEVVAATYSVDYPTCPRLSVLSIVGTDNPLSSNFGCSSVTNLEAMIADPRDLVQGESGGTVDAQITNAAIHRYRQHQTFKLQQTDTQSLSATNDSSTGGGGGGGTGGGGQ